MLSTCRFTAARINEALSLKWENVTPTAVVIPMAYTKKKMGTRTIPMHPELWEQIDAWRSTFATEPFKADWPFEGYPSETCFFWDFGFLGFLDCHSRVCFSITVLVSWFWSPVNDRSLNTLTPGTCQ